MIATEDVITNALDDMKAIAFSVVTQPLLSVIWEVLEDARFQSGFGSKIDGKHKHHCFRGGLPCHTHEVLLTGLGMLGFQWEPITRKLKCQSQIPFYAQINLQVYVTAAILHDYCKIFDYDEAGYATQYRHLIRHVSGTFGMFMEWATKYNVNSVYRMQIGHCILAHHGRLEWESPVLPQTLEAQVLHYADMLSMLYGATRDMIDKKGNVG